MNLVSQLLNGAIEATGLLFPGQGADSAFDLLMPGLVGVAAAVAVAVALTVYFRTGYRSVRDIVRHGFAAALVLGLLAFAAYDMRNAALAYLGINPAKPATGFEMRWPKTAMALTLARF
jgi:integral membrane sensor domain MASE1